MKKSCPIYQTVNFIGKRWTLLVITELYRGKDKWKRYSKIRESIREITPKMLSSRLKELEGEGMIKKRIDANKFPIKSEYCLTQKGEDFVKIIKNMKSWGLKWKLKNEKCLNLDCKECEI